MDGPRLDQFNLVVSNMEQSIEFYRLLGLDVPDTLPEWQQHHRSPMVSNGEFDFDLDSRQSIAGWNNGANRPSPTRFVIGFRLPTRAAVDETYERLVTAGYGSQQIPYDAYWGTRYAVVEDPDGNAVGLMSPREDDLCWTPPAP